MKKLLFSLLLFGFHLSDAQENNVADDTTFVNIKDFAPDILLDMKYATADNFLKESVYPCAECYLRKSAAIALAKANKAFLEEGFRIKIFDCYRPLDIQKKMWQLVPNADYVADPSKGSLHNRGLAVDLTIVREDGSEVDMGTAFDHFGPESAFAYDDLPKEIRRNRKFLNRILKRSGFRVLKSEWWHYNFQSTVRPSVSNFKWDCPN